MALWGATAGLAPLVGPILGGVLVDVFGWEWIFFINVPVGLVGFVPGRALVPTLPTHPHRFDWLGVALSGVGMFLLVFGIQEGHQYDWGMIAARLAADHRCGLVVLARSWSGSAQHPASPWCRSGSSPTATSPWPTWPSRPWASR